MPLGLYYYKEKMMALTIKILISFINVDSILGFGTEQKPFTQQTIGKSHTNLYNLVASIFLYKSIRIIFSI